MFNFIPTKVTAKPYYGGKPARLEWSSKYYPRKMFKNLRRASVLVFTRRRTLNPESLNPKTLKTLNPKAEYTANTQYFLQFLFSCSTTGNPSMLQSGQTTGSVRQVSYI